MSEKELSTQISPENWSKILVLLAVVAVVIGCQLFLGRMGADRAEKRGHPRHFGFLLCFYFGPIGLLILNKMEVNRAVLERYAQEAAKAEQEKAAGKSDTDRDLSDGDQTSWKVEYIGKRPNYNAVYILMGVALALTLYLKFQPTDNTANTVDVRQVPLSLEGWKYLGDAPENDGSADLMKQIKADSYVTRYYQSPTGQQIELYIVYRRYGRREFNHNPDQCFPAGGWQLMKRDITDMTYAGSQHKAVTMLFDGKGVVTNSQDPATGKHRVGLPPATVTYFFASGDRTEYHFLKQQMWMALERLIPNKNGWALIRMTTIRTTNDEDSLAAQKDFMRIYSPGIQKVITTDSAHSHMTATTN